MVFETVSKYLCGVALPGFILPIFEVSLSGVGDVRSFVRVYSRDLSVASQ